MIEEKTRVANEPNPLIIARNRAGATTAEGELLSRIIETRRSYKEARHPEARANLLAFMTWLRDRLAGLRALQ